MIKTKYRLNNSTIGNIKAICGIFNCSTFVPFNINVYYLHVVILIPNSELFYTNS